jgi:leucyl-tRNA synthetase
MSTIELRARQADSGATEAYDHDAVEARWRAAWKAAGIEATPAPDGRRSTSVVAAPPVATGPMGLDQIRSCTIADAYARFRRANGDAVLFALGFDCQDVGAGDGTLQAWEERRDGMRDRLERLGCSCDWGRAFLSAGPIQAGWSQRFFKALLEKDMIYRRGDRWLLRIGAYAEASARGLDALSHWSEDAIDAQREALGEVDGVEVDAVILGGGTLPVFTPYPDSIESAAFIAVSPSHPEADALQTGMQASVPGASTLLPLVISPRVDDDYGATAVLGIPERDEEDRKIAETLEKPAAGAWKLNKVSAKPRTSVRYRMEDVVVAEPGSSSAPAPVPDSEQGGAAPAIAARFDAMWMWLSACAASEEGSSAELERAEAERWLPIGRFVGEPGADRLLLEQRAIAKMLEEIGELPPLEAHEPFSGAVLPGRIRTSGAPVDELIERAGADVVRLAVLNAASPQRSFAWNDQPVRYAERLLADLRSYAEPRLREWPAPEDGVDGSTKWRRRLVKWCRVAADKVAGGIDRLEMQRASHNALLLFTRIKDFESRAAGEDGELEAEDREAVVWALLILLQLLAPFVPHLAEELWAAAGHDDLLAETPWPDFS